VQDHLGNVRMVLTEEVQQDKYPVASLEPTKIATEKLYYDIKDAQVVDKTVATGITNYINDNGIGNNPTDAAFSATNSTKLYQLNSNTAKTGLGITLKVMAGDKIDVFGKSYYFQNNPGSSFNNNLPIIDLLTAFLGAPAAAATTAGHGVVTPAIINTTTNTAGITSMMTQQGTQNGGAPLVPKAFINVIFFDEQFKSYDYRVSMVGGNSAVKDHYSELQNIMANKCGYVYIYCSNETPVNVYFDNLQVVHTRGPILETNEFYPFGLQMQNLCYRSLKTNYAENKRMYNKGSEMQNKEFSDGSGLELYATNFRSLDPQLGRWWQIDPKPDYAQSLYSAMDNNPILKNDPLGDVAVFYNEAGQEIYRRKDGHKYTTATTISNDNLKAFGAAHAKGKGTVAGLQGMGITYDTKSVNKFYNENKTKYQAKFIKDQNIEKATNIQVNNKPVDKLYAEVTVNTVLNNGVVSIGKNAPTTNYSMTGADPDKPGNESNKTGNAHLHPFDNTSTIHYLLGPGSGGGTFEGGKPSDTDHDNYNRSNQGTRFIVVDKSNIILYNGNPEQNIVIPRI
jgi:RHS repeat-associated protein